MDGDFQEKLNKVLSDPDALAKITAIASSLGASPQNEPKEPSVSEEKDETPLIPVPNPLTTASGDPRLQLLSSLKPLLREEKRDKIDSLTRALTVAAMMKSFKK